MVARALLRTALVRASGNRRLGSLAARHPLSRRLAQRFVAGETLAEGVAVADALARRGRLVTLDLVGEHVSDPDEAHAAARGYEATLVAIASHGLPAGISVKPSQLGAGFSVDTATRLLAGLAERARAIGAHITLDMEDHTTTDSTLTLVERLVAAGHDHVGCALQAALHRTPDDIRVLCDLGVSLRLCKGAYAEPVAIAHQRRRDVDAAFARCATTLLERGSYPRFATHDHRMIAHVRAQARRLGRDPHDFEFQMLHGVRPELQDRLVDAGARLCIYVPFGDSWYAYFVRRLAERPANVVFLLRALGR